MKKLFVGILMVVMLVGFGGCGMSEEPPSNYPSSNASYKEVNFDVGCGSKYSDDKRKDIFKSRYKNYWMIWSGEVVLADSDDVSLNIDGKGTQDLMVDFANKTAGYNLRKGDWITVKFVMKSTGGCFLPFSGEHAIIIK